MTMAEVDKDATDSDTRQDCLTLSFPTDTSPQSVSPSSLEMTGGVYPGLQPDSPENRKPPVATYQGSPTRKNGEDEMSSGNWQQGKSVLACNRHMLENQLACDVWFSVGPGRERVGAHRYVLQSRSGVFFAMFDEPGLEELTEIGLPETNPKVFWQFLRYMYYEELHPAVDSVFGLLRLAEEYDLPAVQEMCLLFLRDCLTEHTVCDILEVAHRHDDQALHKEAMAYIRKHGEDVVQTAGMDGLCRDCLNKVLTMDGLDLNPDVREEVTDRWARRQCERRECEPTADNKLNSLGDVIYVKRDDTSSHRYVLDTVSERHLSREGKDHHASPRRLSPAHSTDDLADDSLSVTSHSTVASRSSGGSQSSRTPSCATWPDTSQVTRFREVVGDLPSDGSNADAITFTADRDVSLYGFGIYGSKQPGEAAYRVDTILTRKKKDVVMESISIKGAGNVLPVMLQRPVRLERGKPYTLEVYVHGPPCHCGADGIAMVTDGVTTFTFSRARTVKGNRTTERKGQIPRLYFVPL